MTATYTNPKTMSAEPTLLSDWNTYIRDNGEYLKRQADTHIFAIQVIASTDAVTTGDGKYFFYMPALLTTYELVDADACLNTAATSDLTTIQLAHIYDAADALSTPITIDATELTSYTAAAPPVIDTTHDDFATAETIRVDVDSAGAGALGLIIHLAFRAPST